MKARATIKIRNAVALVNFRNRRSTCEPTTRTGWNALIVTLLIETNNYQGFRYLHADEVPADQLCGCISDYDNPENHQFPDESRIVYLGFDGAQNGDTGNEWADRYAEKGCPV